MDSNAIALSRRLNEVLFESNQPDYTGPCPDLDISGAEAWVMWTPSLGACVDLDHPSNEGHLRQLACEVFGRGVGIRAFGGGWRIVGAGPRIVVRGTHPSPGQAYAAAIVQELEAWKGKGEK